MFADRRRCRWRINCLGRRAVAGKAVKGLGGKLEGFYYCLGEYDVMAIVDLPEAVTARQRW